MYHNFRQICFLKYSHSMSFVGISSLMDLVSKATLSGPKVPQCRVISFNMTRVDLMGGVHTCAMRVSIQGTCQYTFICTKNDSECGDDLPDTRTQHAFIFVVRRKWSIWVISSSS